MTITSKSVLKIFSLIFIILLSVTALLIYTNIIDSIKNFYILYIFSLLALYFSWTWKLEWAYVVNNCDVSSFFGNKLNYILQIDEHDCGVDALARVLVKYMGIVKTVNVLKFENDAYSRGLGFIW